MRLQLQSGVSWSLECLDILLSQWLQFPLGNGWGIHYFCAWCHVPGSFPHPEDEDSPLVDSFQV